MPMMQLVIERSDGVIGVGKAESTLSQNINIIIMVFLMRKLIAINALH